MAIDMDGLTAARRVNELLAQGNWRLVLAESCTCGLIAATLGEIPGISAYLCGSAVTYREATKTAWLGVREETLDRLTAVSREVALQMACGALDATPEADWAVSVTGHLGPNAPDSQDGLVFIGVARRNQQSVESSDLVEVRLATTDRLSRRRETVVKALETLSQQLAAAEQIQNRSRGSTHF